MPSSNSSHENNFRAVSSYRPITFHLDRSNKHQEEASRFVFKSKSDVLVNLPIVRSLVARKWSTENIKANNRPVKPGVILSKSILKQAVGS